MRVVHPGVAVAVAAVLLFAGSAVASTADLSSEPHTSIEFGGLASDQELEEFLKTAEVVSTEDIGEGITRPQRLTLRRDGVACRAIFKTVDQTITDITYTNRFESVFTDSYVNEVAAYRVDRLLGIGLIPVTVVREVNGQTGSVQYWIENAVQAHHVSDQDLPVGDTDLLLTRLMLMYVLDSVIYNIDRNFSNILLRPASDEFFLIDHSRAFRNFKKLPSLKEERDIPVPECVARRLRALDLATLQAELGGLLSKQQIRAMDRRRELLIEELEGRGLLP